MTFTVADIYLWVVASWSGYVGVDLSGCPNLQQWQGRVARASGRAGGAEGRGPGEIGPAHGPPGRASFTWRPDGTCFAWGGDKRR